MKTLFTCFLLFFYFCSLSQQKESTVSISCYVNPELYLKGGIITFVSNKSGNFSCKGRYVTIYNGSEFPFYYRLSSNIKTWIEVKPLKQVIIPVPSNTQASSGLSVVRLYAKYQEEVTNNISLKMKTIAKMNSESDKVKARELRGVTEKPDRVAQKPGKAATSKSIQTAKAKTPKVKETEQETRKTPVKTSPPKEKEDQKLTTAKIREKAPSVETIMDTTFNHCYYASDTAYYSFYYIKIRDTVLYSFPFPVERYEDEAYGQRVLSNASGCLSEKITQQFGEYRYNQYLNDVDYDIMTGFQHIRNPHIPSDTIINEYPYTKSFASAEAELKTWIRNEQAQNKEVKFIEIDFP